MELELGELMCHQLGGGGAITPFAQLVPTALILQKVMCHEKATLEAALNLLVFYKLKQGSDPIQSHT